MKHCVQTQWGSRFQAARTCLSVVQVQSRLLLPATAGKSLLKVVFGESENALDIVAVHPKWNTTSIKQTRRAQPIHQRAAWISYWVQLRRDKCRTSSVCPRLPIDRDHHCDVAFYLATCSLKLYIILFPTRRSHRRTGKGWERARFWLYLLFSVCIAIICSNRFHGIRWSHHYPAASNFFFFFPLRVSWWFLAPAAAVCSFLDLFHGRRISFWLTCCCSLTYWPLSTCMAQLSHRPPSAALIQMCQIQLRGKRPGSLLIGAIMEFHGNKLPWLTVTVQWLGPTLVMWPWRASSLWEAIMGKWSFAIELCNDKYWLISVGLTVLSVQSPIIAVLLWVHHNPLLLFSLTSRTHSHNFCCLLSIRSTIQNEIIPFV